MSDYDMALLRIEHLEAEVERLQSDRRAAAESFEQVTALWEARGAEIERLRAVLEPFAEVARWARRNGHDLTDFDMLLRGPGKEIAGHLQVQSANFIRASEALGDEQSVRKKPYPGCPLLECPYPDRCKRAFECGSEYYQAQ